VNRGDYLFHKTDLAASLRNQLEVQVPKEVDAIPEQKFIATPVEDLVEHLISKMEIEPLILYEEQATRSQNTPA